MTQNPKSPEVREAGVPAGRSRSWVYAVLIVLGGLLVYWPALHGAWLWDDRFLFAFNPDMRTVGGLERIWFGHTQIDYWPLTSTALWLEVQMFGNHPFPYHVVSLALHIWSGFLIWTLFSRLGLRLAWVGGLLFVVHPLAVESVAWLSELKNTLSLPLALLSLLAWLDFETDRHAADYRRSLIFYVLAMLAKTSVIMLPGVILLYCWWKRSRVTLDDIRRVAPFFIVTVVFGVVTKASQSNYTLADAVVQHLNWISQMACAGCATAFYLAKFVFPFGLMPVYPRWVIEPPSMMELATIPLLLVVLAALWMKRATWGRHALLGFGFFLLNVLPVSGLVIMSYTNITWVADHLVYLPMIGLIGLVVAGLGVAETRLGDSSRELLTWGVVAMCAGLALSSHLYAKTFVSEIGLWTYTTERNPSSWLARFNLANAQLQDGAVLPALDNYERALKFGQNLPEIYNGLGNALARIPERLPDAVEAYEKALAIDGNFPKARVSLGHALEKMDRPAEAMEQFRKAIEQNPNDVKAHVALGDALAQEPGDQAETMAEYRAALGIVPDDGETHFALANVLATMPDGLPEAVKEYRTALALEPGDADIHNNFAGVLMRIPGGTAEAITQFEAAVRIKPNFAEGYNNLGMALATVPDRLPEAVTEFETALRMKPDDVSAHYHLAVVLSQMPGRAAEAIPHLEAVLAARPDFGPARELLAKLQAGR